MKPILLPFNDLMVEYVNGRAVCHNMDRAATVEKVIQHGDLIQLPGMSWAWMAKQVLFAEHEWRLVFVRINQNELTLSLDERLIVSSGRHAEMLYPGRVRWNYVRTPRLFECFERKDPLREILELAGLNLGQVDFVGNGLPTMAYNRVEEGIRYAHATDGETRRGMSEPGVVDIEIRPGAKILVCVESEGVPVMKPVSIRVRLANFDVTREQIADVVAAALFGPKADHLLVEGLKKDSVRVTALHWIRNRFDIVAAGRGDSLRIDGKPYPILAGEYAEGPDSIRLLIDMWGPELLRDWFSPRQREWVEAYGNFNRTLHWIRDHYEIKVGNRFGTMFLSIEPKGRPERFREMNQWYSGKPRRHSDYGYSPLEVLLDALGDLRRGIITHLMELCDIEFFQAGHSWKSGGATRFDPGPGDDFAYVYLDVMSGAFLVAQTQAPAEAPVNVVYCLTDGGTCYRVFNNPETVCVRVRRGEEARIIVAIDRPWNSNIKHEVYGFLVSRSPDDEIRLKSYDPGCRYQVVDAVYNLFRKVEQVSGA